MVLVYTKHSQEEEWKEGEKKNGIDYVIFNLLFIIVQNTHKHKYGNNILKIDDDHLCAKKICTKLILNQVYPVLSKSRQLTPEYIRKTIK